MGHSIYLADDEKSIRELLHSFLASDGYTVRSFESGDALLEAFHQEPAELVILDIMMPGTDGLTVCRELRSVSDIPIILLTAKDSELDYVMGISQGSDDYLTKPFRLGELRARVAAHLRRQHRTPQRRFRRGGLDFDLGEKAVYWGEQPVKLTRGEYAICEYLALHSGQTFSKEQIYEAVFGFDAPGDQAAVTEHIKNIRAKLRALDCHPIDTVWGVGYRWKRDLP